MPDDSIHMDAPPRIFCPYCRVDHLPLHLEGCNPFAPSPEKAPIDPLSLTIDMAAMLKEANRTRRR
jgi:hypothetical protein